MLDYREGVWVAYPSPGHASLSPQASRFLARLALKSVVQWMGVTNILRRSGSVDEYAYKNEMGAAEAEYAGPPPLIQKVADAAAKVGMRIKLRTF